MAGKFFWPGAYAAGTNLRPLIPASRQLRAYAAGYRDQIASNLASNNFPGALSNPESEKFAYTEGWEDAEAGIAAPFLAEVAPEPPPPDPVPGGDDLPQASAADQEPDLIAGEEP